MQGDTVLITGGTGLIGKQLVKLLREKGYNVLLLGRKPDQLSYPPVYQWNYKKGFIEEEVISQAHYIIHLAGAGISEKRWTQTRKKEIIDSRVHTTNLLFDTVSRKGAPLKAFISSSAIGFYGSEIDGSPATETDLPGNDFLAETCIRWEESARQFQTSGFRTVFIRTGLVLATEGGALPRMSMPIKSGVGSALGTGKQFMPWIHIHDLCKIFLQAIEDQSMEGPYNAVAPSVVNNREFTYTIAAILKKRIWLPPLPSFILKLIFGEMAGILLNGRRVVPERLLKSKFSFEYPDLHKALTHLAGK
jgi:uncharacterized protein (TIGR01777 family)